jgi:hypothetical protein
VKTWSDSFDSGDKGYFMSPKFQKVVFKWGCKSIKVSRNLHRRSVN